MDTFENVKTIINETQDTISFGDAIGHANAWNEKVNGIASGIEEDLRKKLFKRPDTSLAKKARKERARELTRINMANKKEANNK